MRLARHADRKRCADTRHREHADCSSMEVMTSFSSRPEWKEWRPAGEEGSVEVNLGERVLKDACLVYGDARPHPGQFESHMRTMLANADFRRRELLWPLPWPPYYHEFNPGRGLGALQGQQVRSTLSAKVWVNRLGKSGTLRDRPQMCS